MQTIVDRVKTANPARVMEVKAWLLMAFDAADRATVPTMPSWRAAIEHLDTDPERLLGCNSILHDVVVLALEQKKGHER